MIIEPRNEMELVMLFCQLSVRYGFEILSAQSIGFPDAIVKRDDATYAVEFEFKSSNFWLHKHDPMKCDLIICWIDDDQNSLLPIVALSNEKWFEEEIVLLSNDYKIVEYWKRRALIAEKRLDNIYRANGIEPGVINDEQVRLDKYSEDDDNKFIELVGNGKSRNEASLEAWKRSYAGNLVSRGKKLLGET